MGHGGFGLLLTMESGKLREEVPGSKKKYS
jgi:hypothetical protein